VNHERRIRNLEKSLLQQEEILKKQQKMIVHLHSLLEPQGWQAIGEAAKVLNVSKIVLRNRVKSGLLEFGTDFRRNGNRLVFNIERVADKLNNQYH
jgi:hypothetical protein